MGCGVGGWGGSLWERSAVSHYPSSPHYRYYFLPKPGDVEVKEPCHLHIKSYSETTDDLYIIIYLTSELFLYMFTLLSLNMFCSPLEIVGKLAYSKEFNPAHKQKGAVMCLIKSLPLCTKNSLRISMHECMLVWSVNIQYQNVSPWIPYSNLHNN